MGGFVKAITNTFQTLVGGGPKAEAPPAPMIVQPAPLPAPKPTPVMPTIDDEAVRRARRRRLAETRSRSGRSSTIMTGGMEDVSSTDKLG